MQKILPILLVFLVGACASVGDVSESPTALQAESSKQLTEAEKIEAQSHFIRGVTAFEMGEYERAIALLSKAYSIKPEEAGILYALMDTYLKMGDSNSAVYFGELAVALRPENKWYRLRLSEAYRQSGRFSDTVAQLHLILNYHPNDLDILFLIAGIESRRGRFEESNEAYTKILNLIGPDRNVYFQKFQNYSAAGNQEKALEQLEEIRRIDPGNIPVLQTLSQFYLETNQVEKALDVMETALESAPEEPELLIGLADIYISQGNWAQAGEILLSIIQKDNLGADSKIEILQYVISRFNTGTSQDVIGDLLDEMIAKMVMLHDDSGYLHATLGEHYSMQGEYDKALHHLEITTTLLPDNESAWRQRLQTIYSFGDYDEVIRVGKEADRQVPDDAFIQFFVGGAYLIQESYDNAIIWLKRAADMPSRRNFRSIIVGTLGDAYAGLDNWEEADEAYEWAIRLDSENDVALNNYAYYLSVRNKKLEYAREMSRKALDINPQNAAYLDTMGWIYFKMGEYDQAKKYIRAAVDTGSASPTVLEHMGDVYEKLGDLENARYYWRKALEFDDSRDHLREKLP